MESNDLSYDGRSGRRDAETHSVIGAAMEVHRVLGHGFLEAVYQDALEHEFRLRCIPASREYPVPVRYKGIELGSPYRSDFLCFGCLLIEIKAIKGLTTIEDAQVLHYLKATGLHRALLLNFGKPRLEYKRLVELSRCAAR